MKQGKKCIKSLPHKNQRVDFIIFVTEIYNNLGMNKVQNECLV